jgi:transposase InsO family protein
LRQRHPEIGLGYLCALFGITRQAYYEAEISATNTSIADMVILTLVKEFRADMPLLGTRKLYYLLTPELQKHGIKVGRDQLFNLLRFHGLLIRRRGRIARTTDSNHWLKKYPNLIIGLQIDGPNQLWINDITYIRIIGAFNYLSLVTDAYSRKIIGYCLYETLEAEGCILALTMAIDSRSKVPNGYKTIHHSDRGVQYCSAEYVDILIHANIAISMTQSGSPYENAIAERVNGTVKNEFNPNIIYNSHNHAKRSIKKIVDIYNSKRPHLSLDYKTPNEAHEMSGPIVKRLLSSSERQKNCPPRH